MKKILLIDDDADLREALSTILSGKYEIKEAESQEDGFQVLKNFSPDLIVLDVMMETNSSGFEMSRKLKNDNKYKDIKILMLTSIDNISNFDFKSNAGDKDWLPVDDYITKPIEPKPFLDKIEKMLS